MPRKSHNEQTLFGLEATITSYESAIERLSKQTGDDKHRNKLISDYKTKLKDANKWYNIRMEEINEKNQKDFKGEQKEFHKRLDVLFSKKFENNFFQQFVEDLRKHLQNRII